MPESPEHAHEPEGPMGPVGHETDVPLSARSFDELLAEAVAFHGHLCPGQVLGIRMTLAGCRALGLDRPRASGKNLVIIVEIDRCATDAIQVLTGVSLGKRTLRHMDYGKMAAAFVDVTRGLAVRVVARDDARRRAGEWAPDEPDPRRAQIIAYRSMPEATLLRFERVVIRPGWLDRRRVRVSCDVCGEGISYQRELVLRGRTLCQPCAGLTYYVPVAARAVPGEVTPESM
jgi:formylmethanofuran dehydrogenase subunit E